MIKSDQLLPPCTPPSKGELRSVDVFVGGPNGGNPVPLVADASELSSQQMQAIARSTGHESAFVLVPQRDGADWRMRFFVPQHEMEMCGHATVGALWALRQWRLWNTSSATIETLSGLVHATWDGDAGRVWISQPPVRVEALDSDACNRVAAVLGLPEARKYAMKNACTSRVKTLVRLPDIAALHALAPDFSAMEMLCDAIGSTGLYPYALVDAGWSGSAVVAARQFPKSSGYPEDAATGIAAAALWGYLADAREIAIGTAHMPVVCTVRQGDAMGRPSAIEVRARFTDEGTSLGCWLSGQVAWSHAL